MILDFSIKKNHNVKNKKLNRSLHTKKTNNTNKLMQVSYSFALTKIQKLQNFFKKSFFFFVSADTPEIGQYARYMVGTPDI